METEVALRAAMLAAIGRELRLVYADILAEGVPEHFAVILRRLDDPSAEGAPPASDGRA
jgi:Anti-sigma factor NepR